jgi:vacuolar-type H+-ATPase subunit I/STV1
MKRPQPSVTDARPSSTTTQSNATSTSPNSNKRKRLAFGTEEVGSPKLENSSHSRSNPAKTNKLSKDKDKENKKQVVNNAKINQFFAAMKKNVRSDGKTEPETMSETSSAEVEALRARCQELEQSCKEMEGQLKAVSNNQTIMHTALKAALCKREKELEELKKKSEEHRVKTSRVLEEFIRQESAREATQLRQQLASDGARLGRITYTRAGMRAVEAWEEGHASKALQQRRIELESRKQYLAELEQSVEESAKLLSEGKKVTEIVAGVTLSDPLAIVEAKESVRLHLVQLHDEWGKLTEEEHKLNAEKAEHIRALKRVASEDASRFRPRPKVRFSCIPFSSLYLFMCLHIFPPAS